MMGDGGGSWIAMWVLMTLFWVAVIGGGVAWFLAAARWRRSEQDGVRDFQGNPGDQDGQTIQEREELFRRRDARLRRQTVYVLIGVAFAALIVVPAIAIAASDWDMDMWDMHGRGRSTSDSPLVQGGRQADVTIEDFAFVPGNLEVPIGAAVTWTNRDSAPHDATARNGDWKTTRLSDNESDTLTFTSPGTFDYYCSIHPSMKARLVVK